MELHLIQKKIFEIRGQKVMMDFDLANLYEVETRTLKQAVKRNLDRFPEDFLFVLSNEEVNQVVSQNVIPSKSHFGGAIPFAFTEQGVAMLSSILKSKKAAQVNIAIMRAFVFIRQYAISHKDLSEKLASLENKYNKQFKDVYDALDYLLTKDTQEIKQKKRRRIGF
jgi:ORF6N domain